MSRRLRPFLLFLVSVAVLLVQSSSEVSAWSIKKTFATTTIAPSHHEDLAERAARCLPPITVPLPGCRRNYVVNPAFFVEALRQGAVEPDLPPGVGDGRNSSRHSLNPRFDEDTLRLPIRKRTNSTGTFRWAKAWHPI